MLEIVLTLGAKALGWLASQASAWVGPLAGAMFGWREARRSQAAADAEALARVSKAQITAINAAPHTDAELMARIANKGKKL
ncbi:MAG: hypothetical protein GC191_09320 [Azospirillum sp.]|nr:hypothetical protein [Azospirillum sp.]